MMLLQVVALLSLGALCSSAPLQASQPTSSSTEKHPGTLVGLMIQEVLEHIKELNLTAAPRVVTVNAMVERCMQSHLKAFISTLEKLDIQSRFIAKRLTLLEGYQNVIPKDLDKECKTVQVTSKVFLDTLGNYLKLLSEKIPSA